MTLNEAFPNAFTGEGFFSEMTTAPWQGTFDQTNMDLMFFGEFGEREVSPLVSRFAADLPLTEVSRATLATLATLRYGAAWSHKYDLLTVVYNPIENYRMTETEERGLTGGGTETISETMTNDLNDTDAVTITSDIYGFNSSTPVPSGTGSESHAAGHTGTVGKTGDNGTTRTEDETRTLTRAGSIGVKTSQVMMQESLDFWKWDFFADIFADCLSFLGLPIF